MDVFLATQETLKRLLVTGIFSYLFLILMVRASGKRTLSKMNAFDFIITVALGSMLSTVIMDSSISLLEGMTAIGLLVLMQYMITFTAARFNVIGRIIKSEPALLFYDGEFIEKNMMKERILKSEVEQAIRKAGYHDYESISAVILETDGACSVITQDGSLVTNLDSPSD